jgi:hypothetical protein
MIDLSCLITSFVTVLDVGDQRVTGPGEEISTRTVPSLGMLCEFGEP